MLRMAYTEFKAEFDQIDLPMEAAACQKGSFMSLPELARRLAEIKREPVCIQMHGSNWFKDKKFLLIAAADSKPGRLSRDLKHHEFRPSMEAVGPYPDATTSSMEKQMVSEILEACRNMTKNGLGDTTSAFNCESKHAVRNCVNADLPWPEYTKKPNI